MLPLRDGFGQSAVDREGFLDLPDQGRIALLTCQVESPFLMPQGLLESACLRVAFRQEVVQGRRCIDLGLEADGLGIVFQGLIVAIEIGQSQSEPIVRPRMVRSKAKRL